MAFTNAELANIANAALDFYMKGPAVSQIDQERPLYNAMRAAQKTFPGGKGSIRGNVKGAYSTAFTGYNHDDQVAYVNPANTRQWNYPWKELHAGISLTHTELKHDGISVVDSDRSQETVTHSQAEVTQITKLMEDKLQDMKEGSERSFNTMLWADGSANAKNFAGVTAFISKTPDLGTTGGISRVDNAWWRNRALTGVGGRITASASNQTLTKRLRSEVRQLRRFGGRPSLLLCGSAFIEALELEVHEKGTYTQNGFVNRGATDIGMADISMRGVGTFMYDPTLDDMSESKFCYFIDPRHLYPKVMEGEDWKTHAPGRPADRYVLYRAVTWTGGLIADSLNCHGVYEVA